MVKTYQSDLFSQRFSVYCKELNVNSEIFNNFYDFHQFFEVWKKFWGYGWLLTLNKWSGCKHNTDNICHKESTFKKHDTPRSVKKLNMYYLKANRAYFGRSSAVYFIWRKITALMKNWTNQVIVEDIINESEIRLRICVYILIISPAFHVRTIFDTKSRH